MICAFRTIPHDAQPRFHVPRRPPAGAYSQALRAGDLVFVSGQLPLDTGRGRVAGKVRRTPAYASPDVSARLGRRTALKIEALQMAGSFKVRGVFNKIATMTEDERRRG